MKKRKLLYATSLAIFAVSVIQPHPMGAQEETKTDGAKMYDSIMLQPWSGRHGGVPPWKQIRIEEFLPAFEAAIELSEAEIETIANHPSEATFSFHNPGSYEMVFQNNLLRQICFAATVIVVLCSSNRVAMGQEKCGGTP